MGKPIKELVDETKDSHELVPFPARFAEQINDLSTGHTASIEATAKTFFTASGLILTRSEAEEESADGE